MVRGIAVFTKYFEQYPDNYVIIGGTALDIVVSTSGLKPRATKDIDIILVVEALSSEFASHFWDFVIKGGYEVKEKSDPERQYYRFKELANPEFPYQIELFCAFLTFWMFLKNRVIRQSRLTRTLPASQLF